MLHIDKYQDVKSNLGIYRELENHFFRVHSFAGWYGCQTPAPLSLCKSCILGWCWSTQTPGLSAREPLLAAKIYYNF